MTPCLPARKANETRSRDWFAAFFPRFTIKPIPAGDGGGFTAEHVLLPRWYGVGDTPEDAVSDWFGVRI